MAFPHSFSLRDFLDLHVSLSLVRQKIARLALAD